MVTDPTGNQDLDQIDAALKSFSEETRKLEQEGIGSQCTLLDAALQRLDKRVTVFAQEGNELALRLRNSRVRTPSAGAAVRTAEATLDHVLQEERQLTTSVNTQVKGLWAKQEGHVRRAPGSSLSNVRPGVLHVLLRWLRILFGRRG